MKSTSSKSLVGLIYYLSPYFFLLSMLLFWLILIKQVLNNVHVCNISYPSFVWLITGHYVHS